MSSSSVPGPRGVRTGEGEGTDSCRWGERASGCGFFLSSLTPGGERDRGLAGSGRGGEESLNSAML